MWKGIVILTCGWLECSSWLIFINFQTELLVPRHGRWLSSVSFFFSLTFGNWTLLIVVIARTYSSLGYFWSFWRNRDWQKISLYTDRFLNWWHVDHVILYSSGCSIDFFYFFGRELVFCWKYNCYLPTRCSKFFTEAYWFNKALSVLVMYWASISSNDGIISCCCWNCGKLPSELVDLDCLPTRNLNDFSNQNFICYNKRYLTSSKISEHS